MKTQIFKTPLVCLAAIVSTACLHAGTITKANDADNLNLTTSWTNGVVPGLGDTATWNSTVTGPLSSALGADTSWLGLTIANPGGAVTITGANTLTVGTNGINMTAATAGLAVNSALTLGYGQQTWNVNSGQNLTVGGTFTRSADAGLIIGSPSVAAASQGTVTLSPALENGVLPWVNAVSSGTAAVDAAAGDNFGTVSGGNIVAYTNATPETTAGTGVNFGGIPIGDNSTVNYDLGVASTGGSMTNDTYVNTLRNVGGAYAQPGTANFRANGIMNSGSGVLNIGTVVQQADTTLNELTLTPWASGITISGLVSDNVNPLHITVNGTNLNGQVVLFSGNNTFSGGMTINGAKVEISNNALPSNATNGIGTTNSVFTSGPLGTGPITLNGGMIFAALGGWAFDNPIIVGPGGGQFQFTGASPDLSINGNITGSGPLFIDGDFNVNGLFLNGDDSGYTGTATVLGSNNRFGTGASGSAAARWIINGAMQAQQIGGATYYLGELSSTVTTGSLCGHAGNSSPAIQNFNVGALNTSSTFTGIIVNNATGNAQTGNSDAAANNVLALTKVGTGVLTLNGANTYTGPTVISGGGLQLGTNGTTGTLSAAGTIQDDANLIIKHSNAFAQGVNFSSSAVFGAGTFTQAGTGTTTLTNFNTFSGNTFVNAGSLFVNGGIVGSASVASGAKLGGNGTIGGVVTVQAGGQLTPGSASNVIGTLTLNNTPVLNGTVVVKLNAATGQSDQVVVTGGYQVNYGGTLMITNIGVPLLAGDSFTIFTAGSYSGSFSSIVGNPGSGLAYSLNNGTISVTSIIPLTPTNITTTVNGSSLTLNWPSAYTGWVLQSQTNNVDGSLQNFPAAWSDYTGSASVNSENFTMPSTADYSVYFRLRYGGAPFPTSPPTAVTAKATNAGVILNWTAPANARTYNVKSSLTSGGPYGLVANVFGTGYTNTGLINGTTYFYVVSAVNQNGETANSAEVNATPVAVVPFAPTVTAQAAHGLVQLNWTVSAGATSYNVKKATVSGGPYSQLANTAANVYNDTARITDGTTYYYVVSGLNSQGEGTNSLEVSATPTATPPATPVTLTATGEYTQNRLNWAPSFGATSYNVKVSLTSGGPYTTFSNTTANVIYNTGLTAGTPYYYIVTALNAIGESTPTAEATATPIATLPNFYDFENTALSFGYTAPPLPALGDPTLPYIVPLPDPFYYAADPFNTNNTASTNFTDWEHHRSDVIQQIENYEIGIKPVVNLSNITVTVTGTGTSRTLTVITTNVVSGTNRTLTQTMAIALPASTGTFPAIIGMNSPNGSVNSSLLTAVAKITFSHDQVTVYGAQGTTDPYYLLYAAPSVPALDTFNTGQFSAWAWGVSRIIDGLYKLNGNLGGGVQLDLSHIAVTGCSYAGKMAMFCGALDERVALTISQESGGGGMPVWRYSATEPAGSVEWLPNTDHNWFSEGMFAFGTTTNVSYLPEDHHQLMAMCAPRALFATDNPSVSWLSNPAGYVSCEATLQVYSNFGVPDRFGFNIVGNHNHCATTTTIDSEMGAYINKFLLGQTNVDTIIRDVDPTLTNIDYARWTQWWGTTSAVLPP